MMMIVWILFLTLPNGTTIEPRLVFDSYKDCMTIGKLRAPEGTKVNCYQFEKTP
jgi:hypothetical protein